MTDTISSLEADEIPGVKELAEEIYPLPMSNEELWFILAKHITPLRNQAEKADRVISTLMARHEKLLRIATGVHEKSQLQKAIYTQDVIDILRGRYDER